MAKLPGDKTPTPTGGGAAERLRMFEEARGRQQEPSDNAQGGDGTQQQDTQRQGGRRNEDRKRRDN